MDTILLGADIGGSKTRVLIAEGSGRALGAGQAGPGNHEVVGYEGMARALGDATGQALAAAGLKLEEVSATGLGVAGYDWPSQRQPVLDVLAGLGYRMPLEIVNDAILGLLAGSGEGWGVAVIAGTGCNCWGWDRTRQRVGHATGGGWRMGEHGGGGDLVQKAVQAMAYEWTRRGPPTALTPLLVAHAGAQDLEDLLEGLMTGGYNLGAVAAPLVFRAAAEGDAVAEGVVRWAGQELGELANGVIRQLGFEGLEFDVVQMGSLWKGSPTLSEAMLERLKTCAPGARLVGLSASPVYGAITLASEVARRDLSPSASPQSDAKKQRQTFGPLPVSGRGRRGG
jgi:N-acetylglucosamine kinase-like BadF-type ATPase